MIEQTSIIIQKMDSQDVKQVELMIKEFNLGNWTGEDLDEEIVRENNLSFVAKTNGEIGGFIVARLIMFKNNNLDLSVCYLEQRNLIAEIEIYNLGVAKNYRRKRIGSLLINELLKNASNRHGTIAWLEVRESNISAINFYLANCFVSCYKRKNFYTKPTEDAVVMKLELGVSSQTRKYGLPRKDKLR